MPSLKEFEYQ